MGYGAPSERYTPNGNALWTHVLYGWFYLIVPLFDGQRVSDGEPVSVNLEIGRFARKQYISNCRAAIESMSMDVTY
jgi:hypothetical protein